MSPARAAAVTAAALACAGCATDGAPTHGPSAAPASPAAAPPVAAPGRTPPFALVADGADPRPAVRVRPGAEGVLRLRVANAGATPRRFALRSHDPWVTVPAAVTVPARQSVPVSADVAVPGDAPAGTRDVRVAAVASPPAGTDVAVAYASVVTARVTVAR